MAGQDVKENEMRQIAIAALLRCLDASGNSGVIEPEKAFIETFKYRGELRNNVYFNDLLNSGIYLNEIGNGTGHADAPSLYGVLLVFRCLDGFIAQICISNEVEFLVRVCWNSKWTDWKKISFTS